RTGGEGVFFFFSLAERPPSPPAPLPLSTGGEGRQSASHEFHPRLAVAHLADHRRLVALLVELPYDAVGVVVAHDQHEADADVDHRAHLRLIDVAQPL